MKKIKKTFIVAVALVMLLTSFTSLAVNTQAASPGDITSSDTIYYFNDYYPTMRPATMATEYSSYNLVYDHKWVDSQMFNSLVYGGYFDDILDGCVVFIDIKTFKPDTSALETLFFELELKNCTTIFVTIYDQTEFLNQAFVSYLDVYYYSDLSRLEGAVEILLVSIKDGNGNTLENTTILVDGRLIDVDSLTETNKETVIANSLFVRTLLNELKDMLNMDSTGYTSILDELFEVHNINIIVHVGDDEYMDLRTLDTYEMESIDYLQTVEGMLWEYICAFGFWELDGYFYTFLYDAQQQVSYLPVYVMEVDPITVGEGGLEGIVLSPEGMSNEEEGLLAALYGLL